MRACECSFLVVEARQQFSCPAPQSLLDTATLCTYGHTQMATFPVGLSEVKGHDLTAHRLQEFTWTCRYCTGTEMSILHTCLYIG